MRQGLSQKGSQAGGGVRVERGAVGWGRVGREGLGRGGLGFEGVGGMV